MNVLFLLGVPADNASSRYRVLKYLPGLAQAGIAFDVREPLPVAARRFRRFEFGNVWQKALYYSVYLVWRMLCILSSPRYDVIVVQRELFPFSRGLMERLLYGMKVPLVYDTDDAMHLPPPFGSRSFFQRLICWSKYDEMMRRSDHVIVVNDYLKAHACALNDRVTLIPMTIDHERWAPLRRTERERGEEIVLGWTGTATSFHYVRQLRQPLETIASERKIRLEAVSGSTERLELGSVPLVHRPWSLETEVEDIQRFDIGLVPLLEGTFEEGKFPFKTLQYMAAGVPVVASRVGVVSEVIEHGISGFLASTEDEWLHYLRLLVDDPELRHAFSEAGLRLVRERYSTSRYVPVIASILRSVGEQRCAA